MQSEKRNGQWIRAEHFSELQISVLLNVITLTQVLGQAKEKIVYNKVFEPAKRMQRLICLM